MHEEDAELVDHLDHTEDKGLVRAVALLEVGTHGGGGDVQAMTNMVGVLMSRSER